MKLILALLLFTSVAVGQGKQWKWTPSYNFQAIDDSTANKVLTVIGKDSIQTTSPFGEVAIHTFLALYARYEKGCYADSTATNGAIIRPWGQGEFWIPNYRKDSFAIDISFVRWEVRWTHREPTFIGFIQYLRGKKWD